MSPDVGLPSAAQRWLVVIVACLVYLGAQRFESPLADAVGRCLLLLIVVAVLLAIVDTLA